MDDQTCILSSDQLTLAVAPLGAEMQYLRTSSGLDLLWNGDAAYWTGRAPVLFPIVGRAVDDVVSAGGHTANMPQHGFARRQEFALEACTSSRSVHVLRASEATRAVYPFEFTLTIVHEIDGATVSVMAEVRNDSARPLPFGFGFHPAFRWPLSGTEDAHFVTLADAGMPDRQPLRPDGLLEPNRIAGPFDTGSVAITDALFAEGALVFPNAARPLRYGPKRGPGLDFTFDNLPDLALWRPVGAPFLCIEPWYGTASVVGDGPEIAKRPNSLILAPGAASRFAYHVTYTDG